MDKIFVNTIFEILQLSGTLLILLFAFNFFVKKYLYKYDTKKQKSTLNSFNILIIITIIFIVIQEFTNKDISLISQIFIIILTMKIIYHILGYYFINRFGKELYIEEEVKSKKLINELYLKYSSKILQELNNEQINSSNLLEKIQSTKIKLSLDKKYTLKNGKIYLNIKQYVSNKTTSLIDIGLIILLGVFAMALIIPIIKPLNDIFNNDYMFAVLAFLGAYVLNPAFPDMYAFFTFVRNKNIDLEKFISFNDNGKLIKGRIIEMTTSHIILKDHVKGITLTIPNMNLHNKVINNLDDINEHLGYKRTLQYVIDFPSYNNDLGIKIKSSFKNILNNFEEKTSSISKQEEYDVWLISDNNGVKIILWYFIKDIQNEEKIKLDIEDFILYEASKLDFDLRTPSLIEIVK